MNCVFNQIKFIYYLKKFVYKELRKVKKNNYQIVIFYLKILFLIKPNMIIIDLTEI